ncbi:MAG: ADOP family duplicated permease [Cyanobacteria bacterium]|nr:ADOP family duplicated permease [Cyanobacteriota bacterium]
MREAEIVDELAQHLQDRHAELLASGVTPDEAVRLTLNEFESGTALAARMAPLRQAHTPTPITAAVPTGAVLSDLWLDVRSGLRQFLQEPGYAWAAVMTLALAIGANTVIFSITNVLVLKPLPIERPESLGWLLTTGPDAANGRGRMSLPDYAAYRDEVTKLTNLAAYRRTPVTVRVGDEAERLLAQEVVGDLQGLWGVRMALGRRLGITDEGPGSVRVAALSHHFWMTRFGGAGDVIGRQIFIDGAPHSIIGVVSSDIEVGGFADVDVWLPLAAPAEAGSWLDREWRPVGRLAAGATFSNVSAQVTAVAERLAREQPDTNHEWSTQVATTRNALTSSDDRLIITLLVIVVSLLLVLACANIMNLLIARLITRRQELAVRTALGATRARVVRQVVTESLLIGLVGGLIGLGIATVGLSGIRAVAVSPFFRNLELDMRVIGFAIVLAFVAPLVFAVVPTWRVLRLDLRGALSEGSTRTVGGRSATRGRSALVIVQVSLAMMLLVVATLIVRTMTALTKIDIGYDPASLLAVEVTVPEWKALDERAVNELQRQVIDTAAAIPAVEAAAMVSGLPVIHNPPTVLFDVASGGSTRDERPRAELVVTTADFFRVFQVPLVAGRTFASQDASTPAAVTVISAEAARRYWNGEANAIGSVLRIAKDDGASALDATVVGVIRDTANADLDKPPLPTLYLLNAHWPTRRMHLVVRSAAPASLAPSLRAAIREVDPDLPLRDLRPVSATLADGFATGRLLSTMFAAFAIMALLLAAAGLYGVVSYTVTQRTPEIALRLALGASPEAIARDVVGGSLRLTLAGVGVGVIGASLLARAMSSVLFGVSASDPTTYLGAAAVALVSAIVASWLPMRRAASVDSVKGLRQT